MTRLRFEHSVEPVVDPDDGLFLFREGDLVAWLEEPVFGRLSELLAGGWSVEEIYEALSRTFDGSAIFAAIEHLRAEGYVTLNGEVEPTSEAAYWEATGVDPAEARRLIAQARASVHSLGIGERDAAGFLELLAGQGVALADDGDIGVVLVDDYLHPGLDVWNLESYRRGRPWLLAQPVGARVWIGPFFTPGSACWTCLAHRLRMRRAVRTYLGGRVGTRVSPVQRASTFATRQGAFGTIATELVRWIATRGESPLVDRVLIDDLVSLERTLHPVTRRPQCPTCGAVPALATEHAPVRLESRPKLSREDGGHRIERPHVLEERLRKHVSPVTGIVGRLSPGDRTGGATNGVAHVFTADHNFAEMYDRRFFLREGLRRRAGGKGRSLEAARLGAVAESIERYSGVFDGTEAVVLASLLELGERAIHPARCLGYSERQYDRCSEATGRVHRARWVPARFPEAAQVDWTPVWSLSRNVQRYVLTSYCYYGYPATGEEFARADSNGCAAGAVLEEAILQGLLELVERDAVAIWWYNRLVRPGVDLDSLPDGYGARMWDHYRSLGRELWLLDITGDLGIPSFAALSRRGDGPSEDIIFGFGSHLDPQVAANRALTEMNQSLEAVPVAGPDGSSNSYRGDEEARRWWREATAENQPYLLPAADRTPVRLPSLVDLSSDDLRDDIQTCLTRLEQRGIETLVLDQTRPDVGFPVVRVIAPGLRHFWARFGPGRLYDVPVAEGLLGRPLQEEELNPFVVHF
jgi:oxazoline/thiazoline synthase